MSLYNELMAKVKGFHEFHDSVIDKKNLKVLAKMAESFKDQVLTNSDISVKIPPHFLLRMAASFDKVQMTKIFNIFNEVIINNNSRWEYEVKSVWDNRQELKDLYESFFLVFKFHGAKNVDLISSGVPGVRQSNKAKGVCGKDNDSKKQILAKKSSNSNSRRRSTKQAKRALKRQLREGGHR